MTQTTEGFFEDCIRVLYAAPPDGEAPAFMVWLDADGTVSGTPVERAQVADICRQLHKVGSYCLVSPVLEAGRERYDVVAVDRDLERGATILVTRGPGGGIAGLDLEKMIFNLSFNPFLVKLT